MKNLHLIPTDKPSKLHLGHLGLVLCGFNYGLNTINGQHIYITSDEEIKEGGYVLWENQIYKYEEFMKMKTPVYTDYFSIILTTDGDLIKDGVKAIDDEFLEWFVKNPSCEFVEVSYGLLKPFYLLRAGKSWQLCAYDKNAEQKSTEKGYMIHLPDTVALEEPKQETLEEAVDRLAKKYGYDIEGGKVADFVDGVVRGAEWHAERTPSIIEEYLETAFISKEQGYMNPQKWFEQFKKK